MCLGPMGCVHRGRYDFATWEEMQSEVVKQHLIWRLGLYLPTCLSSAISHLA
jgi:hypothetical protein